MINNSINKKNPHIIQVIIIILIFLTFYFQIIIHTNLEYLNPKFKKQQLFFMYKMSLNMLKKLKQKQILFTNYFDIQITCFN